MQPFSMVDLKGVHHPTISYRRIRPSDLVLLEKIHCDLFPIRYESEFFHNVVNGHDIVSWGAVDCSRPNGQNDELIGFVTARVVQAKDSEIEDLISFDSSKSDQTLVYILTLGVVESYRNFGIATSLVREVINYASSIPTCRAVYLHLHGFYFINGQHYDSFLFIYYLNGGRSPCSPLELLMRIAAYVRNGLKLVTAKLWKNDGKKASRWPNNKETCCLLTSMQNKRSILMTQGTGFQCV
ncbi:Histone acetyltransferase MCC1 [Camellia lanceoleosa]|uniref:Histone acetyltransferase MCC1 n=1 Tax=Camellia lanceoleosa TaxID=1840588 RepID=A0ACC0H5M9_9ERIC|nr:Histone acetyltransferase MCC1 [Camellia lanceoleosa]